MVGDVAMLGDAILLAQGVTDGMSDIARSLEGFVEDLDVMQSAEFLAASRMANDIVPMRKLVNSIPALLKKLHIAANKMSSDVSGKTSRAEAKLNEVEKLFGALQQAPAKQRASVPPGSAKSLKRPHKSSHAPQPSSPAAVVGPAAIRHALAQALHLDSTSPSDAETLDRMFATLHPSELAAFLPHDTPAVSLRMTIHLARARCATADYAHKMELARARSTA